MSLQSTIERDEDLRREIKRCKRELQYAQTEDDRENKENWIAFLKSKLRKQVNVMIKKRERLLEAMSEDPERTFTIEELRSYLNSSNDNNIHHYLYKVLKGGEVERVSRGKYRINAVGLATLERLKKLELIVPEKGK